MVFKVPAITAVALALGLSVACTDDASKKTAEQVTPAADAASQTPAPAPVEQGLNPASATVFFAYDDYSLTTEAQAELNKIGEYLKTSQGAVVQIEGHCDERGTVEYNLALGERRAQSVKSYLVNLGVTDARLTTISYGEEKPSTEGHDEAAWSKNRRATFVVSAK